MKLLNWFIDTYLQDRWVAREDFDMVQNREFPAVKREVDQLRASCDAIQREYHDLLCIGLERHAFLPKFASSRGTVECEVITTHIRQSFRTRVVLDVSDSESRALPAPLRPDAIRKMARLLVHYVTLQLLRKFES